MIGNKLPFLLFMLFVSLAPGSVFLTPAFGMGAGGGGGTATRIALVIGNSNYTHSPSLDNPANDAKLIAATLRSAGFDVNMQLDASFKIMKRAIRDFSRRLRQSGKKTIGLVYFAGHGTQVSGRNYLIPVDANITSEADVEIEAIDAQGLLSVLAHARNELNIVILDACRNNPFKRGSRASVQGFARMDAPTGALIAYSTQPGNLALDGATGNSPYASALARAMQRPGMMIEQVFKRVRNSVRNQTEGKQVPWEESSLFGDFYFTRPSTSSTTQLPGGFPETGARPRPGSGGKSRMLDAEIAFWNSVKDSRQPAAFQSYLKTFPKGIFAELAKVKLELARQKKVARKVPPQGRRALRTRMARKHASPPRTRREHCLDEYDAETPVRYCVSSVLPPQKGNNYGIVSLLDSSNYTAWIEKDRGDGIGEWILADFGVLRKITGFKIKNGYNKTKAIYFKNSRIRTVILYFSDGTKQLIRLADKPGEQTVRLRRPVIAKWMKFEIRSVVRGSRYKDTCINEFRVSSTAVQ